MLSAHPIALDASALDPATSFMITCACAQIKSRAYARARRPRARRDAHMAVLSAHSPFNSHTPALDAPALDATTRPTPSCTRCVRCTINSRRAIASRRRMASWCMARILTCARTQVKSRSYARARRNRARRDEHMAVLSARSSFSARTLTLDASALDATTRSTRSHTRRLNPPLAGDASVGPRCVVALPTSFRPRSHRHRAGRCSKRKS